MVLLRTLNTSGLCIRLYRQTRLVIVPSDRLFPDQSNFREFKMENFKWQSLYYCFRCSLAIIRGISWGLLDRVANYFDCKGGKGF